MMSSFVSCRKSLGVFPCSLHFSSDSPTFSRFSSSSHGRWWLLNQLGTMRRGQGALPLGGLMGFLAAVCGCARLPTL